MWALALCAATLAFIDGGYLATHLFPTGIWALLIRPALFLGAILCLAALYVEGATPRGPWGGVRRRIGFRIAVLAVVALGFGQEILSLLEPIQPETKTISWSGGENGAQSSGTLAYPVFSDAVDIVAFAASLILTFVLAAILALTIFAPAIAMQSGPKGIVGQSRRAMQKHWFAIGIRALALIPIALIAMPILAYWQIDDWTLDHGTSPERVSQIEFAIDMCNRVGVDRIAYSVFAATVLFGLFLWWMGRWTGVLLDRQE